MPQSQITNGRRAALFFQEIAISAGVRPAAVTIGRQQLKLKANGLRTKILESVSLKNHRADTA